MKVLVVSQNFYPEEFRINDISKQLALDRYDVTVLTGLPNYPTGIIPSEYRWWRKRKEKVGRLTVLRCFEIGRRNSALGLAVNYLSFMIAAAIKVLFIKKDFDLIFAYQTSPVTMAFPGVVMKKLIGRPLYLYCCDIWPEAIKNRIKGEGILFRVAKRISRYIYARCDAISVTSKPFIDYLNKVNGIPIENITYIPQHAEDQYLNMDFPRQDDTVDFVFMGNMGISQNIDCIIRAVEKIRHIPGFMVHFVGDGSRLQTGMELSGRLGLGDIITFHGRHPLEKMPAFYGLADACILTLSADNQTGLTIPSKLQGYMAAGKPVIGAINGPAQEIIAESGCGVCVAAGDLDGLAGAMQDFIEHPDAYWGCGARGRQYFMEHFTKAIFMQRLEKMMDRLKEDKAHV